MKKGWIYINIVCVVFTISCKKEKHPLGGSSGGDYSAVQFKCDTLPPEPGIGWIDTTSDNSKNIIYWAYNPSNNSEIIYLDNNTNLYSYNLSSKTRKYLDNGLMFLPSINKSNWVVYDKLNFTINKIKTNGDSLKQICTFGNQPKWDYTGNNIYYFQDNMGANPAIVIKVTKDGQKIDSLPSPRGFHMCFAKNSDKYIDQIGSGLYLIDPTNSQQTFLTPFIGFHSHMCFDNEDKNIFWWCQFKGLVKLNLQTKQIDTLVRFCENFLVSRLNISPNSDKLTMGHLQLSVPGSKWKLYQKYDPIEYDLTTKEWRKLNILFN